MTSPTTATSRHNTVSTVSQFSPQTMTTSMNGQTRDSHRSEYEAPETPFINLPTQGLQPTDTQNNRGLSYETK